MDKELSGRNNWLSKSTFPKFKCNRLTQRMAIDERNEWLLKLAYISIFCVNKQMISVVLVFNLHTRYIKRK